MKSPQARLSFVFVVLICFLPAFSLAKETPTSIVFNLSQYLTSIGRYIDAEEARLSTLNASSAEWQRLEDVKGTLNDIIYYVMPDYK